MWLSRKKQNNNYTVRETLLVDNEDNPYISIICSHEDFSVSLVLLDKDKNPVYKVMDLSEDSLMTRIGNKYYVFTNENGLDTVYVYDRNFNAATYKKKLGRLEISSVCSNDTNIYAYSGSNNEIVLFDEELEVLSKVSNRFTKKQDKVQTNKSVVLACSSDDFFSIPRFIPDTEEQYVVFKRILQECTGNSSSNDFINSCTFNVNERMLYIAMRTVIFVITEDGRVDYINMKDNNVTNCCYDNMSNRLVVSAMDSKLRPIIMSLTDLEVKKRLVGIKNQTNTYPDAMKLPEKTH